MMTNLICAGAAILRLPGRRRGLSDTLIAAEQKQFQRSLRAARAFKHGENVRTGYPLLDWNAEKPPQPDDRHSVSR